MQIPKAAIERAIEGGWVPGSICDGGYYIFTGTDAGKIVEKVDGWNLRIEAIALDPLFWQALGKALGWSGVHEIRLYDQLRGEVIGFAHDIDAARLNAIRFYHLILTGQDTAAFWQELLTV